MAEHKHNMSGTSLLVTGSGFCALMYQVVWLRELRLIFGGSTAASAATLAILMGGLELAGCFWASLQTWNVFIIISRLRSANY